VDIEYMRALPELEQIAARIFSAREKQVWENLPVVRKMPAFYRLWTQKEAFVKALGKGLSYPLEQFSVSIPAKNQKGKVTFNENPAEAAGWTLMELEIAAEYAAALAVEGKNWRLVRRNDPPWDSK
jgi:4'-phosphopantetheinyl transferase